MNKIIYSCSKPKRNWSKRSEHDWSHLKLTKSDQTDSNLIKSIYNWWKLSKPTRNWLLPCHKLIKNHQKLNKDLLPSSATPVLLVPTSPRLILRRSLAVYLLLNSFIHFLRSLIFSLLLYIFFSTIYFIRLLNSMWPTINFSYNSNRPTNNTAQEIVVKIIKDF